MSGALNSFTRRKTTNCHIRQRRSGAVYCGRGRGSKWNPRYCSPSDKGYWGNPIVSGQPCPACGSIHQKGRTLSCYERYLVERLECDSHFREAFYKLRGGVLECFCKPGPCHTDIMIKHLDR